MGRRGNRWGAGVGSSCWRWAGGGSNGAVSIEMMMIGALVSIGLREPWQADSSAAPRRTAVRMKRDRADMKRENDTTRIQGRPVREQKLFDGLQILFRFLRLIAVGRKLDHLLQIGFCFLRLPRLNRGQ